MTESSIQSALLRCMQQAPLPFAITRSPGHGLVYANVAFRRLAGLSSSDALGAPISSGFAANEGRALSALLDRAFREGVELFDETIDGVSERANGWRCSVWPVIADAGHAEGLGIEIRESRPEDDALELQRQVAEQMLLSALRERGLAEDAEAGRRRAAFLAEAGRMLAESVDHSSTLLALSKLALPSLGAWCIVDILEEDGTIHRLKIHHADPAQQYLAQQLEATWLPEPDDPFGAPAMLRTPRMAVLTENIELTLAASARSAEDLHILRQLGIGSLLTVPLTSRKRLLGAITFVSARGSAEYSAEELQLAQDLADRGALALDNAQVYDVALMLRQTAETANRAKSAFLGAMSHELRTPLNAIGGYIELLDMGLRGPVTEEQRSDFARVKTNQEHLTVLITEILNFVRIGGGRLHYAIDDLAACEALTRASQLVEPLFGQNGLVFDGVTGDSSILVRGDRERVTQILVNLFSNAIKFTRAGGHIGGECGSTDDTVTLSVHDTGIGIPSDRLEAVFEPFVQVKQGLADRGTGVGLGLAISRDLARAMNGDLTVQSKTGQGSRFTLTLPRGGTTSQG